MDNDLVYNRVEQSPRFRELIDKRSRFAWQLTIVMLAIYFAFILVVAFAPGVLGASVAGGVVTWGIPVGIAVIVAAFALTGVYVARANSEFDRLTRQIVEESK
ncbi:MAG: DUF485 domain-containing protein [Geminicoccaceae bacterium]|nr:DUF485 domain-containing protein [Geminicoccaceae bacterium]